MCPQLTHMLAVLEFEAAAATTRRQKHPKPGPLVSALRPEPSRVQTTPWLHQYSRVCGCFLRGPGPSQMYLASASWASGGHAHVHDAHDGAMASRPQSRTQESHALLLDGVTCPSAAPPLASRRTLCLSTAGHGDGSPFWRVHGDGSPFWRVSSSASPTRRADSMASTCTHTPRPPRRT